MANSRAAAAEPYSFQPKRMHFEQQQQSKVEYNSKPLKFQSGEKILGNPPGPPASFWQTFEEKEFYRQSNTSYRIAFCTVNNSPYVSIANWYFNSQKAKWFPTKTQINLPAHVYLNLLEYTNNIADCCRDFQGKLLIMQFKLCSPTSHTMLGRTTKLHDV